MRILVTFALGAECAPWRRLRSFAPVPGSPIDSFETQVNGAAIRIVLTGVGPSPAARATARALAFEPDICISSGLAGGLRPAHRRGEILAADVVSELETGRSVASDPRLLEMALAQGGRRARRFFTTARLLVTVEDKRRLGGAADAVEMESFAVLSEAVLRGVPAVAIRAISDTFDENLPFDFSRFLDVQGKLRAPGLARAIVRAPNRIPALVRLGRESRHAADRLALFLDSYVESLAAGLSRSTALDEVAAV